MTQAKALERDTMTEFKAAMTTPEKLEELARGTATKLIPHTTSVHNVGVITDALRRAAQSASVPEDIAETVQELRERSEESGNRGWAGAANIIEAQAARIVELQTAINAYFRAEDSCSGYEPSASVLARAYDDLRALTDGEQ